MKTSIVTLVLFLSVSSFLPLNLHGQNYKAVDLGQYILDTLGVSLLEKSNPNAAKEKAEHAWVAYWNVPVIIFNFNTKSATPSELLSFVRNKKNCRKIEAVLGYNFFLIAVDSKSLFAVKVNHGEVSYEIYPNTKENEKRFFLNNQYYLKKKL